MQGSHPTVMDVTMLSISRDRTMMSSWHRKPLQGSSKIWKFKQDVSMISAGRPMLRDTTMWDLAATHNPSQTINMNDHIQDGMDISTRFFHRSAHTQEIAAETNPMQVDDNDLESEESFVPDIRPNKRSNTGNNDSTVLPRKRKCLVRETTESAAMWLAPTPSLGNLAKLAAKPRLKSRKILQRNLRRSGW